MSPIVAKHAQTVAFLCRNGILSQARCQSTHLCVVHDYSSLSYERVNNHTVSGRFMLNILGDSTNIFISTSWTQNTYVIRKQHSLVSCIITSEW